MNKLFACAFALFAAIALFSPAPAHAQAFLAITTQDGNCFGVAGDGRSIITKRCGNRFAVTHDGNQLVAFLPDGNWGCIDGYRGNGAAAEVVGCDYTQDQQWYVIPGGQLQNVASGLCLDIEGENHGTGARILNYDCGSGKWNQQFAIVEKGPLGGLATGTGIEAGAATPPPASFGSPAAPSGGAEILSHNGGTLVGQDGGTLVGQDGSTLVGNDGASVVPTAGGHMQNQSMDGGHGGIVAAGGGNLIGLDSATLVAAGGGNATGGYSIQSVGGGFQLKIGSLCLDGAGSTAVVQDCGSATSFQVAGSRLQVMGTNRCVDGWRGMYKVGREEDQSSREAVTVGDCDGSQEQTWSAANLDESAQFFLMNNRYPLCMDVDGGVVAPGRTLLLWKCYDSARPQNQIFGLGQPASAPVYAAPAPVYAAPAPVYTAPAPAGPATYRIAVGALCLEAGTSPVTVVDCGVATRFEMSAGVLKITGTNNCVDGWRGMYKVGREEDQSAREAVTIAACDGSGEQNWAQYLQVGGGFFLKDSRYGLCMDVDGGVIASGRTVLLWKCYDAVRPQNQIYAVMN